jgi:hypothetical protein
VTDLGNTLQSTRATTSVYAIRQIGLFAGWARLQGRYIVDALIRRDGSSLFGPDNRWATFGRASAAWRVAQEPWWSIPAVSELKLHGSYGTAGGSPRFDAQYETFTVGTGGLLSMVTLGNSNLKPELHKETEVGADLELWNRYAFNITYSHAVINDRSPGAGLGIDGFPAAMAECRGADEQVAGNVAQHPLMQRRTCSGRRASSTTATGPSSPPRRSAFFFGADQWHDSDLPARWASGWGRSTGTASLAARSSRELPVAVRRPDQRSSER